MSSIRDVSPDSPRDFRLGEWVVRPSLNVLVREGDQVRLEPKTMAVLVELVARPNALVRQDELIAAVWGDAWLASGALFRYISELRRVLGDDRRSPRYIETISRKGYRLIAPVGPVDQPDPRASSPSDDSGRSLPSPIGPAGRRADRPSTLSWSWLAVGVMFLVTIFLVASVGVQREKAIGADPIRSVAVLPFAATSPDEESVRLAGAFGHLLVSRLSRIDGLRVESLARGTMPEAWSRRDGSPAGVRGLVTGAISRDHGRTRVTVSLTDATTDAVVYGDVYEVEGHDLLTVQGRVVLEIAGAIDLRLTPRERRRLSRTRPVEPGAYDAYLRASLFESRVDCVSYSRARTLYRQALAHSEPPDAAFFGFLDASLASAVLGCASSRPMLEDADRVLAAALDRGTRIDHYQVRRAALTWWQGWSPDATEAAYERVRRLVPVEDFHDVSFGAYLLSRGRFDEAVAALRRSLEAAPVEVGENWALGAALYLSGRYAEAVDQLEDTLDLFPGFGPARHMLALTLVEQGQLERAARLVEDARPLDQVTPDRFGTVPGYVFGRAGQTDRAREWAAAWERRASQGWLPATALALAHLGAGDADRALGWLERALDEHDLWLPLVGCDPAFASLRSDPRFRKILERVWQGGSGAGRPAPGSGTGVRR